MNILMKQFETKMATNDVKRNTYSYVIHHNLDLEGLTILILVIYSIHENRNYIEMAQTFLEHFNENLKIVNL